MNRTLEHHQSATDMECDFLVCGGGIGGISAAIQAGRLGLRTILLEKEWCLGGNGGPLLGVHWAGVKGEQPGWNEIGLAEELSLRLHARNAFINGVMFNTHPSMEEAFDEVLSEAGVTVLRRHCLLSAETEPAGSGRKRISRVRVLNIENLEQRDIGIKGFALDSSGDAALAAMAGAETVMGRESKAQTGERSAQETPDATVAASSITALVVDTGVARPFVPPPGTPKWNPDKPANTFHPSRKVNILFQVDAGGDAKLHPLHTPQELYQQLRLHIYSMWDHMKNTQFPGQAETHELIWISSLMGRRESRRVVGDYMLTQTDLESGRTFPDDVAFAGCGLDFHPPSHDGGYETIFYSHPPLHGIPLRSLYSRNVENLFCAGRNISATHLAQGGIRLIRTCSIMAQATAVAASVCRSLGKAPRDLSIEDVKAIQQVLLRHDALLLGVRNEDPADIARVATVEASSEVTLSAPPATEANWMDATQGAGILFHCYPEEIESARLFVRNPGKETTVKLSYGYAESPQKEWPDVRERLPHERYVWSYQPIPPAEFSLDQESTISLPEGFSGWVECVPDAGIWKLKPYCRTIRNQAAWLAIEGPVEVAMVSRPLDIIRPILREDGKWKMTDGSTPALEITPDPQPGKAAHIVDGYLHREGMARLHQWVSQNPLPQWISLRWSEPRKIRRVILRFDTTAFTTANSHQRYSGNCVADYQLEVETPQGWQPIAAEQDNFLRAREHLLEHPIETSSLRLTVTRMRGEQLPACVHEIRVYEN
jgi:hypothetical protein